MSTIGQNMVGGPEGPGERRERRIKNRKRIQLDDSTIGCLLFVGACLVVGGVLFLVFYLSALGLRLGFGVR